MFVFQSRCSKPHFFQSLYRLQDEGVYKVFCVFSLPSETVVLVHEVDDCVTPQKQQPQKKASITMPKERHELKGSEHIKDRDAYLDDLVQHLSDQVVTARAKYRTLHEFEPVESDVFIVSWMKSGTTLMQNIIYQLMVCTKRVVTDPNGNNYRDISMVIPYIELSPLCGIYQSVHPYHPAVWKTHSNVAGFSRACFEKCRYIYLIRDGKHVARSFLDFIHDWFTHIHCEESLREEYYRRYFISYFLGCKRDDETGEWKVMVDKRGEWFSHVKGWLEKDFPNMLVVLYEDLVADLEESIRTVAAYLEIVVDDDIVRHVMDACDHKKMANDSRFRDVLVSESFGLETQKGRRVRQPGEVGFSKCTISEDCNRLYDEMFQSTFGVKDYDRLANVLRERNAKRKIGYC